MDYFTKFLLVVGVSLYSVCSFSSSSSLVLKKLPATPSFKVSDDGKSKLPCSEISAALVEYNELARSNEAAYSSFAIEVANILTDWHEDLRPLEGASGSIPRGTFQPIEDGANQMYDVMAFFDDNSSQLKSRMLVIMNSLSSCL